MIMVILGSLSSILMGIVLGLIGGGGSILTVPILVYFFNFPGVVATYHSLFVVGICASVAVVPFSYRRLVEFKTAAVFLLPAGLGVRLARRLVLPMIPQELKFYTLSFTKDLLILATFGLVMILAAWAMIRVQAKKNGDAKSKGLTFRIGMNGLGVGFLTGFVGAGGGFLIVPSLVNGVGLPMEKAVGTSLFIIALNSLFGFFGDWVQGSSVQWNLILPFTGFSMTGILFGSYLNRFIPASRLKAVFGWFVLFVGSAMLFQQLMTLKKF